MSTHYQGSPHEKLVLDTWIKFSRANNTLGNILRRNLEDQGLTLSQFGVLEILVHIGPLPVKEISQKLLLTNSNLVTVIDNLVKRELVRREPSTHDRRSIIIHITPAGTDIILPIFQNHLNELVQCFSTLDETQLKTLGSISKDLGLNQST